VGVATGTAVDTCASGLRVRIRSGVCGFAVTKIAKRSPTKKTARPVKIERFKNPPSPTSLRVSLRWMERLRRAGAD